MKRSITRDLSIGFGTYLASVALVVWVWSTPFLLLLGLVAVGTLMIGRWHSKNDIVLFAVGAVFGTIVDLAAVPAGAWRYAETVWVVPVWLPVGWGIAALLLKRVSDTLTRVT